MKRIEAEVPERHLAGLENSLKGMDRLTEKVTFDVQNKGVTVDQAVANVKDASDTRSVIPSTPTLKAFTQTATDSPTRGSNSSNDGTHGTRSNTKESTPDGESL